MVINPLKVNLDFEIQAQKFDLKPYEGAYLQLEGLYQHSKTNPSLTWVELAQKKERTPKKFCYYLIIIAAVLALGAAGFFLYKKGFFKKLKGIKFKGPKRPPVTQAAYKPAFRPLQQPQPQQPQPVNVQLKFQPAKIPARRAAVKKGMKTELDETMKKLKKLSEEKK